MTRRKQEGMCFCTQPVYSTSLLRTDPLDTCPVRASASMSHLWSHFTPFHVHTLGQHSCHTPGCLWSPHSAQLHSHKQVMSAPCSDVWGLPKSYYCRQALSP